MRIKNLEKQRHGRNKKTTINNAYINSGEFRRKFDTISNNLELNRLLYSLAKKMLKHRSGTMYEDMYWIDLDMIRIVAAEVTGDKERQIIYKKSTIKVINTYNNLLTIHSHPNSFPPSINDFNSNYINGYSIGVIICHDGKVYIYSAMEEINENYYSMVVAEYLKRGYDENEAQLIALEHMKERFDIQFREVLNDEM